MGVVGKPGLFVHVEGEAQLVKDKARFTEHWDKSLDRWFEQGIDTPGLTMIEVAAKRIHYWDGEDEGEVGLPATAAA
jgi:general stress protein 26